MIRLRTLLVCLSLLSIAGGATAEEESSNHKPTAESLKATITAWDNDMHSDDASVRVKAIEVSFPTADDVAVLFPDHAEKLNRFLGFGKKMFLKRFESATKDQLATERDRLGPLLEVEVINVREEDVSGGHEKVLKLVAAEIPVYRAVTRHEKITGGSSSYIFVNDHWIYFQGFSSIPELLPQLDKLLEKLPRTEADR